MISMEQLPELDPAFTYILKCYVINKLSPFFNTVYFSISLRCKKGPQDRDPYDNMEPPI